MGMRRKAFLKVLISLIERLNTYRVIMLSVDIRFAYNKWDAVLQLLISFHSLLNENVVYSHNNELHQD